MQTLALEYELSFKIFISPMRKFCSHSILPVGWRRKDAGYEQGEELGYQLYTRDLLLLTFPVDLYK